MVRYHQINWVNWSQPSITGEENLSEEISMSRWPAGMSVGDSLDYQLIWRTHPEYYRYHSMCSEANV